MHKFIALRQLSKKLTVSLVFYMFFPGAIGATDLDRESLARPPLIPANSSPSVCAALDLGALDLIEAIQAAFCYAPKSRQAQESIAEQLGNLGVAKARYYPTIEGRVSANKIGKQVKYPDAKFANYGLHAYSGNADLGLNWLLYDSGQRSANSDKAEASLRAAVYSQVLTNRDQAIAVADEYYKARRAIASVAAAVNATARADQNYRASQKLLEGGVGALTDELLAKGAWQRSLVHTEEAEKLALLSIAGLAAKMGIPRSAAIGLSDEPRDGSTRDGVRSEKVMPDLLFESALARNPRVAASRARSEAALAEARAISAQNSPTVSLQGSRYFGMTPPADSTMKQNVNGWAIGLQLNIPLYDGSSTAEATKAANARWKVAQLEEKSALLEEELKLLNDYQDFASGLRKSALLAEAEKSANSAFRAAQARYREGVGTIVELLKAQEDLATVQQDSIGAHYEMKAAAFRLSVALDTLPSLSSEATSPQ